ncbi:MAG: hypothetical protein M3342_09540 [Bacteroidota bacterium]|nr:hypothetical protein [Flavisolibacter sp.]MBD0374295.1 hypothetical protein [Flavisolibacter sp.]MDQ3844242.1 hypothetical protein [Bacteroidota bacterium]
MKKVLLSIILFSFTVAAFSQSDKYVKAMEARVAALDTTRSVQGLTDLTNAFERIATAEKTQWLPYYYAALATVNSGYFMMDPQKMMSGGMADKLDPVADKAEALLNAAEALSKDNSEIYVVRKMIATLRMSADPMKRYMQYGPQAQQALEKAKQLNPENPRVYLLEGQDKLYTPEQFGGSKTEAKRLFEEAVKKYDAFKPESTIAPNWGRGTTQYFMGQIK